MSNERIEAKSAVSGQSRSLPIEAKKVNVEKDFQEALKNFDYSAVYSLLKSGFTPSVLDSHVLNSLVYKPFEDVLITINRLFEEGIEIPETFKEGYEFALEESRDSSNNLIDIISRDPGALLVALRQNPSIVKGDERGSLLHRLVKYPSSPFVLNGAILLVLNNPELDLSIQDDNGNTVLHLMERYEFQKYLPQLVSKIHEQEKQGKKIFSLLNKEGNAFLHLYKDQFHDLLISLLQSKIFDLNLLSGSGATLLAEAIRVENLELANFLLDEEADVRAGKPGNTPLEIVEKLIANKRHMLEKEGPWSNLMIEVTEANIAKLETLKKRIIAALSKSHSVAESKKQESIAVKNFDRLQSSYSTIARTTSQPETQPISSSHISTVEQKSSSANFYSESKEVKRQSDAQNFSSACSETQSLNEKSTEIYNEFAFLTEEEILREWYWASDTTENSSDVAEMKHGSRADELLRESEPTVTNLEKDAEEENDALDADSELNSDKDKAEERINNVLTKGLSQFGFHRIVDSDRLTQSALPDAVLQVYSKL